MAETAETNFDEFKGKDKGYRSRFVENQRPKQALFRIFVKGLLI